MSLYGALSASVAGLSSQSNKIGVISDNIANVSTVGYKQGSGQFETLVTNSGLVSSYSPGGVLAINRALVSKQGLLQGTDSATDIAISGAGFFVVRSDSTADGSVLYTRSGSFRQDNLGNFRNSSGFYLQGWPLDADGRLPGESGNANTNSSNNISSLETVNVQTATGAAAATTTVELSANLRASQTIYPGSSAEADMDTLTVNSGQPAKSVIVPGVIDGVPLTADVNHLARGDKFSISTGNGLSYTYRYGGFTYSRDLSTGNQGDSGTDTQTSPIPMNANAFTTALGDQTVTALTALPHGLSVGDVVTITGQPAIGGIPPSDLNQTFVVTSIPSSTEFTFEVSTASGSIVAANGGVATNLITRPYAGIILDASNATSRFLGVTGTSSFREESLSFTINTEATGTLTFTYTNSTPNPQLRQFNTLENLAEAINSVSNLTARVSAGRLYVGTVDANASLTFANGQVQGDSGPPVKAGIDWVRELGLQNVSIGDDRFNSLKSLAALINASSGLDATLSNELTEATLSINVEDPLDTITFTDLPEAAAPIALNSTTTPFGTSIGSNAVTVTHPAAHGFSTGDLVTIDATAMPGYFAPFATAGGFTTNGTTTVRVNHPGHTFLLGDSVYVDASDLSGFTGNTLSGIPLAELSGNKTITSVGVGFYTFTTTTAAAGIVTEGTGNLLSTASYNGIPATDFNGTFEITVSGPSTYVIRTAHDATATGNTGSAGITATPPVNTGSVLAELGLVDSLAGGVFTQQTLGPLGPEYNATDADKNMAGGNITPQYSQNLRIYDSLGSGHDLKASFIKVAINTWAVEVFAANPDDVSATFVNGLLASGTITFNGDGTLRSVSSELAAPVSIPWVNGAEQSSVTFDWGTAGEPAGTTGASIIGLTDGMSQFDASYKVNFVNQNGAAVGQLVSVIIDENGFVIANYNNGESQSLYKVPIAVFSNPDELGAVTGNVFQQSSSSGEPNLREAGTNGAGKLQPSTLESSTVDLSKELTDLIIAQRAYQANTKIITTADSLLEELNNTVR